MNILALDLGTKTGVAFRDETGLIAITWKLPEPKKGRDCCAPEPRLLEFRELLGSLCRAQKITHIVYEDVKFVRSQAQAHLWSGFRAVLWLVAKDLGIVTLCVPVQTLKKFATGHGNADKDAMALALMEEDPTAWKHDMDDNAVDAVFLLRWAEEFTTSTLRVGPRPIRLVNDQPITPIPVTCHCGGKIVKRKCQKCKGCY